MKTLKNITTLLTLMLIPFFAASAGNSSADSGTDENIRTIEITGTDRMKFDVTEIVAAPGEQIRIVLTVESRIPKAAMAHNVVVLDDETDLNAFANAAAMARDNQYIPQEFEDQIIAATDLAGGGETVEVTFTVPEEAGSYTYICSFPGHYLAGMKGTLVVKESLANSGK